MSRIWRFARVAGVCGLLAILLPADTPPVSEALTQHINLGKAFYENPTTQSEALAEFAAALELNPKSVKERLNYGLALLHAGKTAEAATVFQQVQKADPSLPHSYFALGIIAKKDGNLDEARKQFEAMLRVAPGEAVAHYNLGAIARLRDDAATARVEFEKAGGLDPSLAAPHFALYNLLRGTDKARAAAELALFQKNKKAQEVSGTPEDMDWCRYAEIFEPLAAQPAEGKPVPYRFDPVKLPGTVDAGTAGMLVIDADGDGRPDLLVWSKDGVQLYLQGRTAVKASGLETLRNVVTIRAGDFDNDGLSDLCVITAEEPMLFVNRKGRFERVAAALPKEPFHAAVWVDYDHDYDLDLLLLGKKSYLFRNQGQAGFIDHSEAFPFAEGEALDGVAFRLVADSKTKDIAVSYRDRPGVVYVDRLTSVYERMDAALLPVGATRLSTADVDNEGGLDLVYATDATTGTILNTLGQLKAGPALAVGAGQAAWADLALRGRLDAVGPQGVLRNEGLGKFETAAGEGFAASGVAYVTADFDGDGRMDLATVAGDGTVLRLDNRTPVATHWLSVALEGVKNLKQAPQAEVEVKAGGLYQKQIYQGYPLVFGTGPYATVDTIRVTWPNGLIQNELRQPTGKPLRYREAQRLSGSCPLIFTWDGEKYRYITDVLGVAPLGAMSGDGQFFPTDHHEYVYLPNEALRPRDGQFDIRMTEELSEVSYFDQVELLAVDHPEGVEIYSNEKWKSPPFPEFRLYGLRERVYPVAAHSQNGTDQLASLLHQDLRYADDFRRNYVGVAEPHYLELDFGDAAKQNRAFLVLNGWVDWADGSTFLQQAQEGAGLTPPSLQVQDAQGNWKTVIEDMGMPSGKPKTIAVDLAGKFLSASRKLRIVTNLCVFWDEIYLGEDSGEPEARVTHLTPAQAEVHFRGFSPSRIHPERKQPETFAFNGPQPVSYWNPTPGNYTRYGDVTELVQEPDDRMVIMGSGDELHLRYAADRLPPLASGYRRDYLLLVDGWAKDRDANTAFSQSVEPLPFHAMSRYPYPAGETYPVDAAHETYRKQYNTRPALRLIRPLTQ